MKKAAPPVFNIFFMELVKRDPLYVVVESEEKELFYSIIDIERRIQDINASIKGLIDHKVFLEHELQVKKRKQDDCRRKKEHSSRVCDNTQSFYVHTITQQQLIVQSWIDMAQRYHIPLLELSLVAILPSEILLHVSFFFFFVFCFVFCLFVCLLLILVHTCHFRVITIIFYSRKIFSFMPPSDICVGAARVNRKWHTIAYDNMLWRNICFQKGIELPAVVDYKKDARTNYMDGYQQNLTCDF
jgi:hypothetical protein